MNTPRDPEADALSDATHDAFLAFWRAADTGAADELWTAYCAAQVRYETVLLGRTLRHVGQAGMIAMLPAQEREVNGNN
jgi:hypothetical protein